MVGGAVALCLSPPMWAAQPHILAGELHIGGTGAALGTIRQLGEAFRREHPAVRLVILPGLGSGGGIKALMANRLAASVSSRPLTEAEQAHNISATEIARTPFVFATGLATPVSNLSLQELAELYAGRKANWADGTQVRPVLRPLGDVDTEVVRAMSPALAQALDQAYHRPGKNVAATDSDSADETERIPGALGTSTLSLIRSEDRRLKALAIGGVEPTLQNAASGKYAYLKSIYLVMPARPSALALSFARFVGSPGGKQVLAQAGNLPMTQAGEQ
jgi:phosphate transport system substrate-binding protein